MAADVGEEEAVLDVRIPSRRRRASDDEAEESEFHDAAEYAASVADSQGQGEDRGAADASDDVDGEERTKEDEEVIAGEEEPAEDNGINLESDQPEQAAVDRKKAKVREPFEVPTSGAFWLHDDRFGEEAQAEPARPSTTAERKARSDTEGRWLHDKFSTLDAGGDHDDDGSENAFSHFSRRGRGRGTRGGRRGSGREPPLTAGRGRTGSVAGGRRGRGDGSASADGCTSEPGDTTVPTHATDSVEEAPLMQRPPRAPRARTYPPPMSSYSDEGGTATTTQYSGPGRGRGRAPRGGRGVGIDAVSGGRGGGRGERAGYVPEGSLARAHGQRPAAEGVAGDGYGRGAGRGGRGAFGVGGDPGGRSEGGGRGFDGYGGRGGRGGRGFDGYGGRGGRGFDGYGGRGGRGYGRGADDHFERETGGPPGGGDGFSGKEPAYEGSVGRGRGRGPLSDGYGYGRGSGVGRGGGGGRGAMGLQQYQHPPQQQRKQERTMEEEFPPLPGSNAARSPIISVSRGADGPASSSTSAGGQAAAGGVRRYSRMAGKVGGADGAGGGTEGGRPRGGNNDTGTAAAGAAPGGRTSKLSATAPTFEPNPAAKSVAGEQQQQQYQPQPVPAPQPVPSVPLAYGAPLQPMTAVPQVAPQPPPAPAGPMGQAILETDGAQLSSQQPAPQQPPTQAMAPPPPQHMQQQYNPAVHQPGMPQQGVMGGPQIAPQPMQAQYGAYSDMESWFQDAYQKALATGMDPQQAYGAVQGYVQGMQMAYQTIAAAQQQHRAAYPQVMPQAPQGPPPPGQ